MMINKKISRLIVSFAIGLAIFFVLNSLSSVSASCKMPGTPIEELEDSDAVFIGKVRSIEKMGNGYNRVNFLVIDGYKGVSENTVNVIAADPSFVSIGIGFEEEKTYLVYTYKSYEYEGGGSILTTFLCSRSALLENAKEDTEAFAILSSRSGPIGELLIISNDPKVGDLYSIENIEVVNQDLVIDFSYSGGCEEHEFDLYWDGSYLKSNPVQAQFVLSHNANGDSCKAIKYETLRFDIYPFIEDYIESYGDNQKVNIYIGDKDIEYLIPDYSGNNELPGNDGGKICTQEAKLCPDGKTYVSRNSNNNCEFDDCPQIAIPDYNKKSILVKIISWFDKLFG